MTQYSLICECGRPIEFSAGAAGHQVVCQGCQVPIQIPRYSVLISTTPRADREPFIAQRNPWFTVVFPGVVLLGLLLLPPFVAGFLDRQVRRHVIFLIFDWEPRALPFALGTLVFAGLWYWGERLVARPETFVSRLTRFLLTLLGSLVLAALAYVILLIYVGIFFVPPFE